MTEPSKHDGPDWDNLKWSDWPHIAGLILFLVAFAVVFTAIWVSPLPQYFGNSLIRSGQQLLESHNKVLNGGQSQPTSPAPPVNTTGEGQSGQ